MADENLVARIGGRLLSTRARRTVAWLHHLNDRADSLLARQSHRTLRATGAMLTATALLLVWTLTLRVVPLAAAQGGGADDLMCGTGAGQAVTLLFGVLGLALALVAAFRAVTGLNDMGSARSDKIRQGQDKLKGAGLSMGGVFVLIAFPALLEAVGISTFSCVTFSPFG